MRHYATRLRQFVICATLIVVQAACTASGSAKTINNRPATQPDRVGEAARFSHDRLYDHIAILSNDAFTGRGTGTPGNDLAAGYIAGQFAAAGLEPGGTGGSYIQPFSIKRGGPLLPTSSLSIGGLDMELELADEFIPFSFSATGSFEGDIAFVGYGAVNDEIGHDDYRDIDVQGRVLLMLRREPPGWSSWGYSRHASFRTKLELAEKQGAVAVLIVNNDDSDVLMPYRASSRSYALPAIHIRQELADELLTAGGLATIDELREMADRSEPVSQTLSGVAASGSVDIESRTLDTQNVIGILPAPGSSEYVVIGGHFDHLGIVGGEIHNGADDNASGTAAVMELAFEFAQTRNRKRNVVFMAFSGEEMGLHGSRHFVDHPTIDLSNTVAMLNMDMIGRLTPGKRANMLAIQGLGTGSSYGEIVNRHADALDIEFIPEESALGPSDHSWFYKKGVPSLFFFTGIHEDYHQPGDDIEKVNIEGTADISELVYRIARDFVVGNEIQQYARVDKRANIFRETRRKRPVLGVLPSWEDKSSLPGWGIDRVFPESGAARAGLVSSDRLVSIADTRIQGRSDLRKALAGKEVGDRIELIIFRDGGELTIDVELTAAPDRRGGTAGP